MFQLSLFLLASIFDLFLLSLSFTHSPLSLQRPKTSAALRFSAYLRIPVHPGFSFSLAAFAPLVLRRFRYRFFVPNFVSFSSFFLSISFLSSVFSGWRVSAFEFLGVVALDWQILAFKPYNLLSFIPSGLSLFPLSHYPGDNYLGKFLMDKGKRLGSSSSRQPIDPSDDVALRERYPFSSFWLLGTSLTEEEKLSLALRGRSGGRSTGGSLPVGPRSSLSEFGPIGSGSVGLPVSEAVPSEPITAFEARPPSRSESLPGGYLGPCWDCVAESSSLIASGQDRMAEAVLGSCRHGSSSKPASVSGSASFSKVPQLPSTHSVFSFSGIFSSSNQRGRIVTSQIFGPKIWK